MHFFISLVIFFPEDTIGILRYFFGKVIEYLVELFQILTKVQMVEEHQLVGKLIFFIYFWNTFLIRDTALSVASGILWLSTASTKKLVEGLNNIPFRK